MKTLLGIPLEKLDTIKYIKQLRGINLWKQNKGRGTMECATGFGKSIIACLTIKKLTNIKPESKSIVIVPTLQLKSQWEILIKSFDLKGVDVYVINTIALKNDIYNTDLLILDEIHMYAADKFKLVFENIKYKWVLGLTATLERLDGRDYLLSKYAPVVMTVTQKEAIEKGWINDFFEINIPVYLTRDEKVGLANLSKQIRMYTSKFGDFDTMRNCMNSENAKAYAALWYPHEDLKEMTTSLVRDAVNAQRCVRKRQEFLYKTYHKVEATVDLINEFGLKAITFSQSTSFADEVKKSLGKTAVVYHSNLDSISRKVTKKKLYKSEKGARSSAKLNKGEYKKVKDGYEVSWKVVKKIGKNTLKKESLERFSNSSHGIKTICTAKALDQGFDVPDVQLGIDASRTSNPTQHTQRTGRIARNYTYEDGTKKQGIYINLYVPNSTDEKWLRKCQKNNNVLWLDDINECINLIKTLLKK